jgi:hypothetical protein
MSDPVPPETVQQESRRTVDAYYLYPPAWIGSAPPSVGGDLDLDLLKGVEYRGVLAVGIEIMVLREGLFMFDFANWPPAQDPIGQPSDFEHAGRAILRRVQVMNGHLACLYSALSDIAAFGNLKMYVRPADRISMQSFDLEGGMGFGDPRVAGLATSRFRSTYSFLPAFDSRIATRYVMESEVIEQSMARLDALLDRPIEIGLALVDLVLLACRALEDHNYALSLLTSWVVCERLLSTRWDEYIAANRERGG